MKTLLSRQEFKQQVFAKTGNSCAFCDQPAVDAHHILDRKLREDGGYYIDNGCAVCEIHHLRCETGEINVADVRKASFSNHLIPSLLYSDIDYDKWGNVFYKQMIVPGALWDESIRKTVINKNIAPFRLLTLSERQQGFHTILFDVVSIVCDRIIEQANSVDSDCYILVSDDIRILSDGVDFVSA